MADDSKSSSAKNNVVKPSIFRQESLERLSSPEQLDQLMQVVNSKSWMPLATLGSLIGLAVIWSIFGRIPITATGRGTLVHPTPNSNQLVNLTWFDSEQADRIQPGMQVIIVPDGAGSDAGGLLGQVTAVSGSTVTTLEAARQAINSNLSQPGTIEVLAELNPDPKSVNGYQWSSMDGSRRSLMAGMTTTTRITLEEKAPIAFVFPFLEAKQ